MCPISIATCKYKKKEAYHSPSFPPQHHHTKQPHPQPRLLCITPQTPTPSTSLSHWPRQLARKTDITSALKVLPIHPDLWRFFGLSQRGCVYSPFGCRSINIIFLLWSPQLDTQRPQLALHPPPPGWIFHIYFVILPSSTRFLSPALQLLSCSLVSLHRFPYLWLSVYHSLISLVRLYVQSLVQSLSSSLLRLPVPALILNKQSSIDLPAGCLLHLGPTFLPSVW